MLFVSIFVVIEITRGFRLRLRWLKEVRLERLGSRA